MLTPSHSVLSLKDYNERNSIRSESSSTISISSLASMDGVTKTTPINDPMSSTLRSPVVFDKKEREPLSPDLSPMETKESKDVAKEIVIETEVADEKSESL